LDSASSRHFGEQPPVAKDRSHHRQDNCPIDVVDPVACWVRTGCRYWNRELAVCGYRAFKDAEREKRRAEGFNGSAVMERIRITDATR